MNAKLTEVERHRIEKLIWLYCLEFGDEGPCSSNGSDIPTAEELSMALIQQGVSVDVGTMEAILDRKLAISDELAALIEQGFVMPGGWLSN